MSVNWASGGGAPKPKPGAPIPTAREVEQAVEVSGESAAVLDPDALPKLITQERLRLYLESKEYAEREKKDIQAALDAGASVEAGAIHAKVNSGSEHEFNFRKELVSAADALIKAGILTGFQSGEDYVQDGVSKAGRKPWRRLEVKR